MKIKVLRAFLIKGERQEVGSEIETGDGFALELIHVGRAERVDKKSPARKGPMTTASSPALVAGAVTHEKEQSNAQQSS